MPIGLHKHSLKSKNRILKMSKKFPLRIYKRYHHRLEHSYYKILVQAEY